MKTLVLTGLVAVLLSGCIAVPYDNGRYQRHPNPGYQYGDRQQDRHRDRDRDGVPDSRDRRPMDGRYY